MKLFSLLYTVLYSYRPHNKATDEPNNIIKKRKRKSRRRRLIKGNPEGIAAKCGCPAFACCDKNERLLVFL
jgi:hypothetical protein